MTASKRSARISPFREGRVLAIGHLRGLSDTQGSIGTADLLGGTEVLGPYSGLSSELDPLRWDSIICAGLPLKALDSLVQCFRIPQQALLKGMGLNVRSLQRRRKLANAGLSPNDGARTVAFATIVVKALDVLGSPEAADNWLSTPNQALGGAVPLELAGRQLGNQATMNVLIAIHHGMFSG